jgi:hypothetical protein
MSQDETAQPSTEASTPSEAAPETAPEAPPSPEAAPGRTVEAQEAATAAAEAATEASAQASAEAVKQEWGGEMTTITYVGPDKQECLPVLQFTGERFMENGKSYEVPAQLAEALSAGSSMWKAKEE